MGTPDNIIYEHCQGDCSQGKGSGGPSPQGQQSLPAATPACCVSRAVGGLDGGETPTEPDIMNSWEAQEFLVLGPCIVCLDAVLAYPVPFHFRIFREDW